MGFSGIVLAAVLAQAPRVANLPASEPRPVPRVGLALSGGAARALAHIGVLKVLERAAVPVDVIAGTSMGSVIGGLYAVGYGAARLDTIVGREDWSRLLSDPVDRRDLPVARKHADDRSFLTLPIYHGAIHLPRGVVPGERAWELLTGLTWAVHDVRDFRRLPIPFVAVATDLETGAPVALDHGFLPDVMRASMAIPSVFTPVELEGRVLIDGGVVRNLPAEDARALGADVLICSDVTDPLAPRDSIESLLDVLVQSVSFRTWDAEARERQLCDLVITPDVHGFSAFAFDRAAAVIARGEEAARAALPAIEAKLAGARAARGSRPTLAMPDSVLIVGVRFEPAGRRSRALLAATLGLKPPAWVSPRSLGERMERLYATGWFANVHYRLDRVGGAPSDSGRDDRRELTVLLSARPAGRFALGWRYDSRYKASVLATSSLGTRVDAELRLGQQIRAAFSTTGVLDDAERVSLAASAAFEHAPVDLFQGGRRVAEARVDLGALEARVARSLGTVVAASLGVKAEEARWAPEISAADSAPTDELFTTAAGVVELDTYDRGVFPSRGLGFRARTEWGGRLAGAGAVFSHHAADVRAFLPLGRRVSLWAGGAVGASGGTPPRHYLFFLGGANTYYLFPDRAIPFAGLHVQERRGRHVQKAELGLQWKLSAAPDVFARLRWNSGTVLERWAFTPRDYTQGVAFELAAPTRAGRAGLSVSKSGHAAPILELDLGYPF